MEKYNTIKYGENKIVLTTETEHQTFEPLKNPEHILGTNFITYKNVRYFLTKTKPKKTL